MQPGVSGGAKRVLEGTKRQKDAFLSMHCHRRNAKIKTFGGGHGLVGPPLDPPVGFCVASDVASVV